jgi:hypothetical protein
MYASSESREFSTMRRHRRRLTLSAIFANLCAARDAAAVALTEEADKLEAQYGDAAIAVIRDKVQAADRKARRKLYRLHDELARRRRHDEADDFAGLMA